jgi:hypothetical protein
MSSPRQALKAEVSRARVQQLEPMIKGSGGVEYGMTEWKTYTLQAFLNIS